MKPSLAQVLASMVILLTALTLMIVGVFIYSAYFEKPFLSYQNLPFPVDQKVYPGQPISVSVIKCNADAEERKYVSTLELECEGKPPIVFRPIEVTAKPGCHPSIAQVTTIPLDMSVGTYCRSSGDSTIKGLTSEHRVRWNTILFEVIQKPRVKP